MESGGNNPECNFLAQSGYQLNLQQVDVLWEGLIWEMYGGQSVAQKSQMQIIYNVRLAKMYADDISTSERLINNARTA